MIRLIVVPQEKEFVIRFPEEMIGKPTEILAFNLAAEDAPAEAESEPAPNRDTFLSYLQNSGFARQGQQRDGEAE